MAPPDEMVRVPFCSVLGFEQPPLVPAPVLPASPSPASGLSLPPLAEPLAAALALFDGRLVALDALLTAALAALLALLTAEPAVLGALLAAPLDAVPALLDCIPPMLAPALLVELPWALLPPGLAPFAESLDEQATATDESRARRGTAVLARIMVGSGVLAPAF